MLAVVFALPAAVLGGGREAPRVGQPLPTFEGKDLHGKPYSSQLLKGRRALVLAITDRSASAQMNGWVKEARARLGRSIPFKSVITLRLPFFISEDFVRQKARPNVPGHEWDDTLIDKDGRMGRALGLPDSDTPFAFALDEAGRVVAMARGPVSAAAAAQVWGALEVTGVGGSGPASK